jgi:hypothetical protein
MATYHDHSNAVTRWKLQLPNQWKDSGASRECMPGIMDPNMTVANATHNTSMILLHHQIAYSGAELAGLTLPHMYSAETCRNAAIEIAAMVNKFLARGHADRPVTPQLGFCALVGARVLLGKLLVSSPRYTICPGKRSLT